MKLFLSKNANFHKLITIIIIIANCILTVIGRKLTQEEWHTIRFGGDNNNQWDVSNGDNTHNTDPETHPSNVESEANIETNVQTVNVGKDKLVLVNDEGTIKMVRASQLPVVPKPESTTPSNLNIQSHDLHQYSFKTGTNNQHLPSTVRYITPNHGTGHQVTGLPITYAIGAKSNMQRQINNDDCPCRRSSEFPQIFMSAPETSATASVNEKIKPRNMVRIIIEMPESMTKDVEEASRYAATQVKKMIVPSVVIHKHSSLPENASGDRKIKNVQEIIRKVVHLEDDYVDVRADEQKEDDKQEELLADNLQSNSNYVRLKSKTNASSGDDNKRFVVFRNVNKNNDRRRKRIRKNTDRGIKGFDKYRKVIKIY